ncbi:MAG: hypothetical protein KJO91_09945 [Gammaproteobacteria bacterium]|nr:hypothetical protein [Gammaproteobacteria bacterium]
MIKPADALLQKIASHLGTDSYHVWHALLTHAPLAAILHFIWMDES